MSAGAWVWWCVLVTTTTSAQTPPHLTATFVQEQTCPGKVVNPVLCPLTVAARYRRHCARACLQSDDCWSFSWDSNLLTCRLCSTVTDESCLNTISAETGEMGFRKQVIVPGRCENGGTPNVGGYSCTCPEGYAGTWCQRRIYDCTEAYDLGYSSKVYRIRPPLATEDVSVYCQTAYTNGRTYLMKRGATSNVPFNRTWSEYRNGFGLLSSNHWVGLHAVRVITNGGLVYQMQLQLNTNGSVSYKQFYNAFGVGEEADFYPLRYDSTQGHEVWPLGDSLALARGNPFSTYDADHDADDSENCALRHQSGWWFPTTCNRTEGNPLGHLPRPASGVWSGLPSEAFWKKDLGNQSLYLQHMYLYRI